jgi:primosomal protein N' (replication factor Y)
MHFVDVILPLSLAKTFTYSVSEAEFHFIKNWNASSSFGKSKIYTALVIDIHQNKPALYDAKEIHQILEEQPIVTEIQIAHGNGLLPIICVPLAMYIELCRVLLLKVKR